jgi:hypothetical protein
MAKKRKLKFKRQNTSSPSNFNRKKKFRLESKLRRMNTAKKTQKKRS